MKPDEYNRIIEYQRLEQDAKTLNDAALIIENHQLVPYTDERKHEIVLNAMSICRTAISELFRDTAFSIRNKMEEI